MEKLSKWVSWRSLGPQQVGASLSRERGREEMWKRKKAKGWGAGCVFIPWQRLLLKNKKQKKLERAHGTTLGHEWRDLLGNK